MANYPFVECDAHPKVEPGYMVCKHIHEVADIEYFERATSQRLGAILCRQCHSRVREVKYLQINTRLSCAQHLRERGLLAST